MWLLNKYTVLCPTSKQKL
jgi:hypothetical protein